MIASSSSARAWAARSRSTTSAHSAYRSHIRARRRGQPVLRLPPDRGGEARRPRDHLAAQVAADLHREQRLRAYRVGRRFSPIPLLLDPRRTRRRSRAAHRKRFSTRPRSRGTVVRRGRRAIGALRRTRRKRLANLRAPGASGWRSSRSASALAEVPEALMLMILMSLSESCRRPRREGLRFEARAEVRREVGLARRRTSDRSWTRCGRRVAAALEDAAVDAQTTIDRDQRLRARRRCRRLPSRAFAPRSCQPALP